MSWKDFLYFQRSAKIAVTLLLILIALTLVLNTLSRYRNTSDAILMRNDSLIREFEEFHRTLTVKEPSAAVPEERKSSAQQPSDRNGYPYESASRHARPPVPESDGGTPSRAYRPAAEKLSEGETISLNETDTAVWKKIPGIGSVYASRIVKYREMLGGFVRAEQLLEVYGIDRELFARMAVYIESGGSFRKIPVNQAEFRELLRHPYLNNGQVKVITELRRRKGNITSIRELSLLEEFSPEDISRLEPYLEF